MGKEIEIKLAAPDVAALEAVGADARVEAARTGAWQMPAQPVRHRRMWCLPC